MDIEVFEVAALAVMMTREDVLRELELLPLWTLRTPQVGLMPVAREAAIVFPPALERQAAAQQSAVPLAAPVIIPAAVVDKAETVELTAAETLVVNENLVDIENPVVTENMVVTENLGATENLVATQKAPLLLQHMRNDSGDCMFVFAANQLNTDEATLLRNMVMAMAMKTKPIAAPADIAEQAATQQPKLLIALGETTAQYLLDSTLPLADLRGSVHAYQGIALVASYDLAHLLQTAADKAGAWDDLCLGLHTLQSLKLSK